MTDSEFEPVVFLAASGEMAFLQCCSKADLVTVPLGSGVDGKFIMKVKEPLTVIPSVVVKPCGCNVRIKDGQVVPV